MLKGAETCRGLGTTKEEVGPAKAEGGQSGGSMLVVVVQTLPLSR